MAKDPTPGDQPEVPDTASTDAAGPPAEHSAVTPMRASIAMMIVGALVLFVGMLSTTAASPQPDCPTGTELIAKFEVQGTSYVFEKPAGNEQIVSLLDPTLSGGDWTSTTPISVVLVKGGPGSKATTYDPAQLKGTFSNADLPPVGRGNLPDISNIQFCAPPVPVTTTTTVASTTSTDPYDTTTTTEDVTAFVRITAICLDQQGYKFRIRHEGGSAPVTYNLQIANDVLYGPASIAENETQFVTLDPPKAGVKVILLDGATNTYNGTASTNDVPCEEPTTTTTEATTTTNPDDTTTTTEEPTTTTTEATTTTNPDDTTTTTEEPTTTTTEATTTTEGDSTTTTATDGTTTTLSPDVAGRVQVATQVTPNDAEVRSGALAFTGGSSAPLLAIGIVLLLAGTTLALVTRARSRQAAG